MPTFSDQHSYALRHAELVHRLGGEACVVPVPTPADPSLLEVGSLSGLPVWSTTASPASTMQVARRLARRGMLGLVLSERPGTEHIHLAMTLTPVRIASTSALNYDALLLRRLRRVARGSESALGSAIAIAEALDVDAAGRRTFRLLHRLIARAVALLPDRVPAEDRRAWALTQLTRLLFLRFVEAEGWLDGNPRFLADAFDRCLLTRRDPTRQLMHPLFFGTLNRPVQERTRLARAFGAVPFLNGGLFEPHPLERRWKMRLPVDYWRDAFAALIDRVDVTLDHDADDGRVTPELLGRVFEGVMDGDERHQEGTYFTPPALAELISREAIACHLAPLLGRSEAAVAVALCDPDLVLRAALLDIRVLDPAAGSGAFLVAMLALLHGPGPREAARVDRLVTGRLFGVDRHPGAVRLAELRLWLEVLRAHRGEDSATLPPLPNLDTSIRAGDALIDPVLCRDLSPPDSQTISAQQELVASAHGAAKRRAISQLARIELAAVVKSIDEQQSVLDAKIAELLSAHRAPTLFGEPARLGRGASARLRQMRRERAALRTQRRRLLRQATSAPFAMAVAFAPIISEHGGFDLVIGNPPWVRAERIDPAMRAQLSERYRWWRSGDASGWRHLPDLSVAFVERSHQLLRPGGTMALLVPSKLATAGYATAMRAGMAAHLSLHAVADLAADPRAGFDATTYPLALIASRRQPSDGQQVRLGLVAEAPVIPQREWQRQGIWCVASPAAQAVRTRLMAEQPRLADQLAPQLGLKTGANEHFLHPPASLARYCRRAVRGRDVRPFLAASRALLLWPAESRGEPWPALPTEIAEHLESARPRLQQRSDLHRGPWWRLFRTNAATAPFRVIWCDLAPTLRACALSDPEMIPLNSCYLVTLPSALAADALTAWLNSTWIGALARLVAEPASGGCARFGSRAVGSVPLPLDVLGDPVLAAFTQTSGEQNVREALDRHVANRLGLEVHEQEALLQSLEPHDRD